VEHANVKIIDNDSNEMRRVDYTPNTVKLNTFDIFNNEPEICEMLSGDQFIVRFNNNKSQEIYLFNLRPPTTYTDSYIVALLRARTGLQQNVIIYTNVYCLIS